MSCYSAFHLLLLTFVTLVPYLTLVSGLGCQCSAPLGSGSALPGAPYWLESMKHQGISAFNPSPGTYQVFRNVKDFGAKGDGVTDDTAAINAAMSTGMRCGLGCASSTTTPALVYFPVGTYVVSSAIPLYYYTEVLGDARDPPTIMASSNFSGMAILDADPFPGGGGAQWYVNQNNFFRSVKNIILDTTQQPPTAAALGLHWQVSQATSLYNVQFKSSTAAGNTHRGLFMENGSGGFMGDLVFNGGSIALDVGNQQFTVRNVSVSNAGTAVRAVWNWGWHFQGVTINNCQIGFDVTTGSKLNDSSQGVEAEAIMDAVVSNTTVFYRSSQAVTQLQGSIVLNNIRLTNVPTAVGIVGGAVVLPGGTTTIDSWVQGNVYSAKNGTFQYTVGNITPIPKASSLLSGGNIYGKGRPFYANYAISEIVSVRDYGATGDGYTDDTAALQAVFDQFAGCKIIFFDAGTYIVTSTLKVPAGVQIYGEAWAVIMGSGMSFGDQALPTAVVQVGAPGSTGIAEIGGILFSTRGPTPGAIVVEWNVAEASQGAAGMWDSYIRLGGAAGTDMQQAQCPTTAPGPNCYAAFLGIHLTCASTAYFEGTWVWLADHDFDGTAQETIYSGRGILSESQGPVWLIGTAEHHVLYQYNLAGAANHYLALPQTETPYFQPNPAPPAPFNTSAIYHDPLFTGTQAAWALTISSSNNILIYGAGFYSFFQNYVQTCLTTLTCQNEIVDIDCNSSVNIYSMSTVGTTYQLSVGGTPVIAASDNLNGFAQTVTVWTSV